MVGRKIHVRQHVGLAVVDELSELRPVVTQLASDSSQCLAGRGKVRLDERLAQGGRCHALLGLRDVGKGVAHSVAAAALPGRAERPVYGRPDLSALALAFWSSAWGGG